MPSLDVPVPQMVDQLPDIEHFFAALSPDPEQVIEVPKFLPLDVPMRAALRVTQLVEQLVDVPTTVSYSSLRRTVEQIVDIPAPRGRGKRRVQGFLPEQSTTAQPVEQLVDIPSSRRGLYGSLPEQGTTAQTVEQIVDIPSGGVCGPGSSSAASAADEDFTGVFRTFFHGKKVRECRAGQCGRAPARQLLHAGGSARHVLGETHSCSVGRVGAGQGRSEEGAREQEEEEEEEEEEAAEVLCATSSSFWLWISSLFSTCWTRILRSFLICCILLRSLGIW